MKKLMLLGLMALTAMLTACATVDGSAPTPAQIAARVCPSATAVLEVLTVSGAVDPQVEADLLIAKPLVETACAAGTQVTAFDLNELATKGVPALLKVIQASSLPDKDKAAAALGIAVAQAALAPLLATAPIPTVTAPAAASAPVAK